MGKLFTHLPHYGEHYTLVKQAQKSFAGEVLLAKEGLKIDI